VDHDAPVVLVLDARRDLAVDDALEKCFHARVASSEQRVD
jgi:hypothetical protein